MCTGVYIQSPSRTGSQALLKRCSIGGCHVVSSWNGESPRSVVLEVGPVSGGAGEISAWLDSALSDIARQQPGCLESTLIQSDGSEQPGCSLRAAFIARSALFAQPGN